MVQAITVDDARQGWLLEVAARNYTASTRSYYDWYLAQFAGWLTEQGVTLLADITSKHIRQYQTHKAAPTEEKTGWGEYTQQASYRAVRAWLNFCVDEGWLTASPIATVRAPKVSKDVLPNFSAEDARRLLAACNNERETALILFLLDTGARSSEAIAVNVGDVDMMAGAVLIREGKGRKTRTVYLGAAARRAMLAYHIASNRPTAQSPLWRSLNNDERLTRSGLQQVVERVGERAGIRAVTCSGGLLRCGACAPAWIFTA